MFEQYFKTVDNPDYVVLVFAASESPATGRTCPAWKSGKSSAFFRDSHRNLTESFTFTGPIRGFWRGLCSYVFRP